MRNKWETLTTILIVCVGIIGWVVIIYLGVDQMESWHITEEVSEYGVVEGNNHNETPEEFLMSFFPEQILPSFENVVYKYKANKWCGYNCEMYLEFTISDPEQFQHYVAELTDGMTAQEFPYDAKYDDYIIHNHLYAEPSVSSEPEDERYFLRNGARMGRILVCQEEQKIICVGMLIDGCCGGFTVDYDFYTRFGINPQEYSDRFCNVDEYE